MDTTGELSHRIFTAKSENDKAINSLKGLLLGISLDKEVNDSEIIELNKWVEKHKFLIQRNPFKEFMHVIQQSINNGIPNNEVIEDLYWLCQKYEEGNYYYNAVTADLQTLQGICHGILADGKINDKEIFDLNKWLEQNEHLTTYYPYDELRSLLLSITSDHKIDEEERLILQAYFNQFVKLHNSEMDEKVKAETSDIYISGLCSSDPDVDFDGKIFCITGILNSYARNELLKRIEDLGGIPSNTVTKKTDYLIVGDNGNPAWAFACYGRKVEKALGMRKEGYTITLIHEYDFFDIIEDFKS